MFWILSYLCYIFLSNRLLSDMTIMSYLYVHRSFYIYTLYINIYVPKVRTKQKGLPEVRTR